MKKKTTMYHTFKTAIFGKMVMKDGRERPVVDVIDGHLIVNAECCDLRTIKERYNPANKELVPSSMDRILTAESFLTMNYGKRIGEINTLFDFITVDCSGGNDFDAWARQVKDLLCFDGLYLPLAKLEAVGYTPHGEVEIIIIKNVPHIRYRAAMQSASENRQCKLTLTTYRWENFARTISGDAQYLYEPTQTTQKAIARQGLGKTNGNVIENFPFTFAVVPDLETEITFNARCFNDAKNEITAEIITTTKVATDGCGFILPSKARELVKRLGLSYLPSAFQIRYGQTNPLTHTAQIRKLNCVSHKGSAYWYRYLNQVVLFNAHDETAAGMAGSDFDGDMCILTKLFTDNFQQTNYIIYNANDVAGKEEKVILTEGVVQQGIRANLQSSMLGVICNINTRTLELLNDAQRFCE
jgi:hypothetical protein